MKTKIIGNYEYECKTHDCGKKLSDIKIPKGWELWTIQDCIKLYDNKKLKKELTFALCWFFIKQPFKNKERSVTWFCTNRGEAELNCWDFELSDSFLGVRFKRKVKK